MGVESVHGSSTEDFSKIAHVTGLNSFLASFSVQLDTKYTVVIKGKFTSADTATGMITVRSSTCKDSNSLAWDAAPLADASVDQEETDWKRAEAEGTAAAYKAFLLAHPSSTRVRAISGNAECRFVLATGPVDSGGGEASQMVVMIAGIEIPVSLDKAKKLGLFQDLGAVQTTREPGPATVYVTERSGTTELLAIER
jgi:hypothetical protein